ncbi:histone-fold-containing protein [Papiliotrema laurentii]|uniref:Histone H2A n=1 Tax=Papiliotrema laurentii TaxID=5418 RepID=A0AAD9L5Q7_PAPLA|nr:histone-fold-containing protein [Papiliotrema laurentii]
MAITSRSSTRRAGLTLSVPRMYRALKRARIANRVQRNAAVYLSAVIDYLVAEVLELSGTAAVQNKKTRITPRFILLLAIRNDDELDQTLKDVTISHGGVVPHIPLDLLKSQPRHDKKQSTSSAPRRKSGKALIKASPRGG